MNEALKDVSLFDRFKEVDVLVESGTLLSLEDTDTGKSVEEKMKEICKWIPTAFSHDEDPLWPKFGNQFVDPLFEARHIGEDEFILVWRDVAFTYYKRFGRSTYISRELSDLEATQFIQELRGTLQQLADKKPYDPLALYRAVEEPLPEDPTQRKIAIAKRQEADAEIARLDAREGYYTLTERRLMYAKQRGFIPNLNAIPSLDRLNTLLDIMEDAGIPEKK